MNRSEFAVGHDALDLGDAAREVVRHYEGPAREYGVELEAVIDGPAPAEGDHDRVVQVVSNLVENAVRAMPDGGSIAIAAGLEGGSVVIEVTDDGPGIAPELRSTLFDRFSKSATSRGSGLGLAIARAIVTAHGGTIDATPGPGGTGTTLRISLPAEHRPS